MKNAANRLPVVGEAEEELNKSKIKKYKKMVENAGNSRPDEVKGLTVKANKQDDSDRRCFGRKLRLAEGRM